MNFFKDMTEEDRDRFKYLLLLLLSTFILHAAGHVRQNNWLILFLFILLYILAGKEVIRLAFLGIKNLQPMDEHFLMVLATLAAFFVGQYPEAIYVMVFYNFGELFEEVATNKSRRDIKALIDIVPETTTRIKPDGTREEIDVYDAQVGDILLIKDGEKVGLDGVVTDGKALIDTSSLTGESLPVEVGPKDKVLSSSLVLSGVFKLEVKKEFDDSIASKIIELIENGVENKSKSEKFISRFSKIYTPIVVGLAAFLAIVPPLFFAGARKDYIFRAATFLVISCPCALVLSIPLTFISGMGLASKRGILIKGSEYIEDLEKSEVLLTDKTGTLTSGEFKIKQIDIEEGFNKEKILDLVYNMELLSNHPLAKAIVKEIDGKQNPKLLRNIENKPGLGILGEISDGRLIRVGSPKFLGLDGGENERAILISIDGKLAGKIFLEDRLKEGSKETVAFLKKHFKDITVLSGDGEKAVKEVAEELGTSYQAGLLPQEKLAYLDKFKERRVCFVGDGINDALILKNADVGISMGETSSDLAIEASDILVSSGEFSKLKDLMKISDLTMKTVRENVSFIILVKVLVIVLGFLGLTNMRVAIFGDVGVSIIAILRGMRIQYKEV